MTGSGLTIWEIDGSLADCVITLTHSDFNRSMTCMNGEVLGRGHSVEDNCYTSTLRVTVNDELIGSTVRCLHEFQAPIQIDNITLAIETYTGKFYVPVNIIELCLGLSSITQLLTITCITYYADSTLVSKGLYSRLTEPHVNQQWICNNSSF